MKENKTDQQDVKHETSGEHNEIKGSNIWPYTTMFTCLFFLLLFNESKRFGNAMR
jgi:hypothetical protein